MAGIKYLESAVTNADGIEGIALRYANFYGPTGDIGKGGSIVELIQKRKLPLIGDGTGVWSFIHYDDAADATVQGGRERCHRHLPDRRRRPRARRRSGCRSSPASSARNPRGTSPPGWFARPVGDVGVAAFTEIRGADNTLAKSTLNWHPGYPSWRDGFRKGL